ncbi:MAG: hypothetical protein ACTSPB_26255 [Candidatus Thorarchaeota archaeon]
MTHPNVVWILVNQTLQGVDYLKEIIDPATEPAKAQRILESSFIREVFPKALNDLIRVNNLVALAMTLVTRLENLKEAKTPQDVKTGMSTPIGFENTLRGFLEDSGLIKVEPTNAPIGVRLLMDRR